MDTKRVKLDIDPTIIEKNLIIAGNGSGPGELDSLFPKHDEIKSKLIQPAPVTDNMSEEVKLELEEENKDKTDEPKADEEPKTDESVKEDAEIKEDDEPTTNEVDKTKEDIEVETDSKPTESETEKKENEAENELTLEFDDAELLTEDIKVIDDIDNKVESTEKSEKTEGKKDKTDTENVDKSSSGRNLWVSGLSHSTRAADLKKHFLSQGRVIGAKIVSNSRSLGARCYGYIVMSTAEEADKCVKNLHHSKLLHRFISVRKSKNEKTAEILTNDKSDEKSPEKSKKVEDSKSKPKSDSKHEETKKSSSDRRRSPRADSRKRHSSKEVSKPGRDREKSDREKSERDKERERQIERQRRQRDEREKERVRMEQRRLRDLQARQRDEAMRLDREKQELRLERERLQREKMELIALEKQQLEKEREEIRRQKRKIEEDRRRKEHMLKHAERNKRQRSPVRRSPPEVPSKLLRKTEPSKYKESERRYPEKRKDSKYKEPSKEEYRGSYKSGEYSRGMDMKYDRYQDEKKSMRDDGIKSSSSMGFEPPPPRISSNEVNHFDVVSHGFSSSSNRFREEFHGKVPFSAPRNVERVSDRFPIDRHDRNEMEMVHRSRSGYQPDVEFGKQEARVGISSSSRSDVLESRMGSRDNVPMDRSNGRYPEGERDMRHRSDPWYEGGPGQKRMGPSGPSRDGSSWMKGNHGNNSNSSSDRHYRFCVQPSGVYSRSTKSNIK